MVDVNKLKGLFREKGITIEEAAKIAQISPATMTRRLSTGIFGTDEIDNLVHGLEIENPEYIFFVKEVT